MVRDGFSCLWQTERQHDIEERRVHPTPRFSPLRHLSFIRYSVFVETCKSRVNVATLYMCRPKIPARRVSDQEQIVSERENRAHVCRSNACENVRKSEHFPEESPIRTGWYLVLLRPEQSRFNPTPGIRDIPGLTVIVSMT